MNSRLIGVISKRIFKNGFYNVKLTSSQLSNNYIKVCPNMFYNLNCSNKYYSTEKSEDNSIQINEIQLDNLTVDVHNPTIQDIDYDAITEGNQEMMDKLKFIILETDSFFQDGHNVPSHIKTDDWKYLLTLGSKSARIKYLHFLFIKEMKKNNDRAKKIEKRKDFERIHNEKTETINSTTHIYYGLQGNTIFHRIYDSYMNFIDNTRAMNSIQLGPDIIIDCDYLDYMDRREQFLLAKQFLFVLSENRLSREPYNVIFSSFLKDSFLATKLNTLVANLYSDDFPFNYTTNHFTELNYKREELVYLSPHTNEVLHKHVPGSVYIIGGMLDKRITQPFSLAKAKKEGIRCVKLPLDHYLDWGTGHKSLTINQMMNIMIDWRLTNDWQYSFRHIPRRKLYKQDESSYLKKRDSDDYMVEDERRPNIPSAKYIKERKKRQLVYDLLLKR